MEVILKKPIRKLGIVGDIVEVKRGYGCNYLIPQGHAVRASEAEKKLIDSAKENFSKQNEELKKEAQAQLKKIEGKNLQFIVQCASDGRLFGSVSLRDIANKVSALLAIDVNYSNIVLEKPVKFTGIYEISVVLHPEVSSTMVLIVAKSETEASELLNEHHESVKNHKQESEKLNIQATAEVDTNISVDLK